MLDDIIADNSARSIDSDFSVIAASGDNRFESDRLLVLFLAERLGLPVHRGWKESLQLGARCALRIRGFADCSSGRESTGEMLPGKNNSAVAARGE